MRNLCFVLVSWLLWMGGSCVLQPMEEQAFSNVEAMIVCDLQHPDSYERLDAVLVDTLMFSEVIEKERLSLLTEERLTEEQRGSLIRLVDEYRDETERNGTDHAVAICYRMDYQYRTDNDGNERHSVFVVVDPEERRLLEFAERQDLLCGNYGIDDDYVAFKEALLQE